MTALLIISDILSTTLAFFTAYFLRNHGLLINVFEPTQPLPVYLFALPCAITLLLIIFYSRGLYKHKKRLNAFSESFEVITGINWWMLLIMSGSYLTKQEYSRIIVILVWVLTLILIPLFRLLIIRAIQKYLITKTQWTTRVLIVGAGRIGKHIYKQLEKYTQLGYVIVGYLDDTQKHPLVVGAINDLYPTIINQNIDQVYITDPAMAYEKVLELITNCPKNDVDFKIVPNIFSLLNDEENMWDIENLHSLDLKKTTPSILYQTLKRSTDLIGSTIFLILSLPLWILIAILIKIDSPGSILIAQERVGLKGERFIIYKFRTMMSDVSLYEEAPRSPNDIRVTNIGSWLRRTSLDELPQLINIIKGDMSLVGPRPEMPFIVDKYNDWQRRRLIVKPGLTGLWQILGRKDLPLHENLEYDFYYINNQSLFFDLYILIKTIPVILFKKGAY